MHVDDVVLLYSEVNPTGHMGDSHDVLALSVPMCRSCFLCAPELSDEPTVIAEGNTEDTCYNPGE